MLKRFALYEGVRGYLVADPETAGQARRYVGMRLDPARMGEPEHVDRFKPIREVRLASHDLSHAVETKTLRQHGSVVVATSHDAAEKLLTADLAQKNSPSQPPAAATNASTGREHRESEAPTPHAHATVKKGDLR